MSELIFTEQAAPAAPGTGKHTVYAKADGLFYTKDSAGVERLFEGAVQSVAGRSGAVVLTNADVGLGNVDNTPDGAKPVSAPQQEALNFKVNLTNSLATNSNLDTVVTTGFYRINVIGAGGPPQFNADYGQLIVSRGTDTFTQIISAHDSGRAAIRSGVVGGAYTAWQEILSSFSPTTSGNFTHTGKLAVEFASPTGDSAIALTRRLTRTVDNFDIPQALTMSFVDESTANRLSAQIFRFTYQYQGTGQPAAFDAMAVFTPIIQQNFPGDLRGLVLEGPVVSAGKTLGTYTAVRIQAPSGAVTDKRSVQIDPGSGPVLIGKTTNDGINLIQLGGSVGLGGVAIADLSSSAPEGSVTYATNGRKVGEVMGSGTGVPVYRSAGFWRTFGNDMAVAA